MSRIRLLTAVKMDSPALVGDENDVLTVTQDAGKFAVSHGLAEWIDWEKEPKPLFTRADLERHEAEVAAAAQAAASAGSLQKMQFPGEEQKPEPPADVPEVTEAVQGEEPLKRPYGNAPKSAWQRYACAVDSELTPERAETMTKADLMSKYGERLLLPYRL